MRQPDQEMAHAITHAASHHGRPHGGHRNDVTLRQLARAIGVAPATLRQRVARGSLPARRVGPLWVVDVDVAAQVVRAGRGRRGAVSAP